MKFPNGLKNALAAARKIAEEHRQCMSRGVEIEQRIANAAETRERELARLGDAEAAGDAAGIDSARRAFKDADLALEGATAGKQAITRRLSDLLKASREPLARLEDETAAYREAVFKELEADIACAMDTVSVVIRRVLAVADGLGVPILPISALSSVPGVLRSIPVDGDWKGDQSAVRAREGVAEPVAIIRSLQRLEHDYHNRVRLERGPVHVRADWASVAHEPVFVALQSFRLDASEFEPGDIVPRGAAHADLMRQLYQQCKITTRASYEAARAA